MSGWIAWGGGKCPVDLLERVEIKQRNERLRTGQARKFDWRHFGDAVVDGDTDIIAYRLSPRPSEQIEE